MSKGNIFETEMLAHVFENADIANIGDAAGLQNSATAGNLYISLHTADPGEAGDQTTNETSYTNYARVAVARDTSNWTAASGNVDNDNAITFAQCGATGATLTNFGVGTDLTGTGKLLYKGALTANLIVSNGITPSFAAGALDVSED
jgi:hypothetical protein